MDFKMEGIEPPSERDMQKLLEFFRGYGITTNIGG